MMEQGVCYRAAEVSVEEDEHESYFASLFGQAIGVTSIMAFLIGHGLSFFSSRNAFALSCSLLRD